MISKISFLVFFTLLFINSFCQSPDSLIAKRISGIIKVDGKLNEEVWENAEVISDFMQARPTPGNSPSEKTAVKILYDDNYLYIGVKAFDIEPGKILASNLQRDKYNGNEDGISFILDTYNDKSHAILFFVNALGARFDEEVIGNEGNFNSSFNTFWDAASAKDAEGYTIEFRIPFSSLRFQSKEQVVMNFKVVRQVARKSEYIIYPKTDVNLPNIIWRLNPGKEIMFQNLKASKPVYLSPYVRFNYNESRQFNQSLNNYEKKTEVLTQNHFSKNKTFDKVISNVGADLKVGLSKNFTMDVTLNTDFGQAEVDNRVFNFTRFNINLPEKRSFFLEAADFLSFSFGSGDNLFNSRNIGIENGSIVPIVAGVRVTGKSNGLQLGFLDMQTQGLQEFNISPQNFTVLRTRKDIYTNGSFVGAMFTNRISTSGGLSNQSAGIDFLRRVNNNFMWGFTFANTFDKGQGSFFNNNGEYNAFLFKDVDKGFSHYINATVTQKKFNPTSGFFYDRGYHDLYMAHSYSTYFRKEKKLNSFGVIAEGGWKWRDISKSYFESSVYGIEARVRYKNGAGIFFKIGLATDTVATAWKFSGNIQVPVKKYLMPLTTLHIESPSTKTITYILNVTCKNFYGGRLFEISPEVAWSVNKHLRLDSRYSFYHIRFPQEYSLVSPVYINHLFISGISYSYSTKLSAKVLLQYDHLSKTIGTNFRARYNPREGTDLYIVYNPLLNTSLDRVVPKLPAIDNQSVLIKFTRTFDLTR